MKIRVTGTTASPCDSSIVIIGVSCCKFGKALETGAEGRVRSGFYEITVFLPVRIQVRCRVVGMES